MEIFIFWFIFSIVVGFVASTKGRSSIGYFLLSILISPLLGLIIILVLSPSEKISTGNMNVCPSCKELVKPDALKCKHCGYDLKKFLKLIDGVVKNTNKSDNTVSYEIFEGHFNWNELKDNILNEYGNMEIRKESIDELVLIGPFPEYFSHRIELKKGLKNFIIETTGLNTPLFLLESTKDEIQKETLKQEDNITKLIELSKLLEKGLITQEEFDKSKARLI